MERILVMGDVHGGYRGMIQALERANFDKEKNTLISLGDIADGWSEVPECVDYLLSCKNLIAIRGNHDMWCRNWLLFGEIQRMWVTQGGQATVDAYNRKYEELGPSEIEAYMESHRQFFKNQINYYIDENNRGFVHGGFTSRKGLGHEPYESNYFWDRDLWNIVNIMDHKDTEDVTESAKRFLKHSEIFVGHNSTLFHNQSTPMHKCNLWNLDTGGGYKGKITVMDVNTKEYWQSDFMDTLYPNEKGR